MPATSYHDESLLLNYLLGKLEDRLAGRHESEIIRTQPTDHCQLGVLVPWSREIDLEEQPEGLADSDQPQEVRSVSRPPLTANLSAEGSEQPSDERAGSVEPFSLREDAGRRPPSSIGLAIALQSSQKMVQLTVKARCAVYTRHFPDFAAQRADLGNRDPDRLEPGDRPHISLVDKFKRHVLSFPPVTFAVQQGETASVSDGGTIQAAIDDFTVQVREDPSLLRAFPGRRVVPIASLRDEQTFHRFLQGLQGAPDLRGWRASLQLRTRPSEFGLRVEIHLCNDSPRDVEQPSNDQYCTLFDAAVEVEVEDGILVPIELLPVPSDYQYDRDVYALGRNASAEISEDRKKIWTRSLARYEQRRMTTQERVSARYRDLADNPLPVLTAIHEAMRNYASDWRDRVIGQNTLGLDPPSLRACLDDLVAFEKEIETFSAGIAALCADPKLQIAFRSMNRAFSNGKHPAWRMFQIVFIVAQLPALAVREGLLGAEWPEGETHEWPSILDQADVLWFPTGGGKTEAYLGLVGCAALYDRLRGKKLGVTAWLRFPLRMLSVQQLQRAARMVWEIEQQRQELQKEYGSLGDQFSLGYFVGSSNTPNQFFGAWSFDRLQSNERQRERLLLVPDCPACGTEGTVTIAVDRKNQRVRHVCSQCNTELPVYVSDDEIYRFQPTLLVGTIDKVAAIAYQPKMAVLWLGPQWRCPCPDHGYGTGDWCINDCPTNPNSKSKPKPRRHQIENYDPSPCLHIQDELHLLQEELGAFAGHYETMVRANEAGAHGKPAKVIAATATIAGYRHQVRQIYAVSEVCRFPNRGYDLDQTFYSTLERESTEPSAPAKVARVFVAFRPPYLRPADAVALCAEALHEFINELQRDPTGAREAVGFRDTITESEIRTLLSLYSRTLTYVGKRDSGVRIRQRLEQDSAREGSGLRPADGRDLNVDYVSGHSTLKEIAAMIKKAEAATPWSDSQHLDATVATHVISHGVDVEYFNLMLLERIPEQVADYIQVSSRSGRQHVGLVLSVLPRYSVRAGSLYDRFVEFHRHLDRMVAPVPVNRFAKAASPRSFPGILLGTLFGRHLDRLQGDKAQRLQLVRRAVSGNGGPFSREELRRALHQSYALGEGRYDESLESQMQASLQRDWERFLLEVRQVAHRDLIQVFDPKPMSSLRDVDVPVPFRPDDREMGFQDLIWFQQRQG